MTIIKAIQVPFGNAADRGQQRDQQRDDMEADYRSGSEHDSSHPRVRPRDARRPDRHEEVCTEEPPEACGLREGPGGECHEHQDDQRVRDEVSHLPGT
jgi:hypothetical protein